MVVIIILILICILHLTGERDCGSEGRQLNKHTVEPQAILFQTAGECGGEPFPRSMISFETECNHPHRDIKGGMGGKIRAKGNDVTPSSIFLRIFEKGVHPA